MDELPLEVIIEIFEKISLSDFKTFNTISKINKKFNFVYKKYFQDTIKKYYEENNPIYIPLNFWFNRNSSLSLPIIALQYHEVYFNTTFRSVNKVNVNKKKKDKKTKTKKTYIKGRKNIPKINKFYNYSR